jgi:hypothetical protein
MRSQVRLGKGSHQILKWNTERLIRSVQNPYARMRFVTPMNDIPLARRYLSIAALSLGMAACSPVGNDPLPPGTLPYTEGYFTQFFPHFFNHKE